MLAVATLLLLACHGWSTLRLRNESDTTYLTRTTLDRSDRPDIVLVEEVPPGADGHVKADPINFGNGDRLELLAPDCSVLGSWPLPPSGGALIIGKSGAAKFFASLEEEVTGSPPPGSPPPFTDPPSETSRPFHSVLRCGATNTVDETSG
jgi:hypothetical protein